MFRLPICPCCHTVYHYSDVRKNIGKRVIQCYHCKKEFRQSKAGITVLFAIAAALAVAVNIIILSLTSNIIGSIVPVAVVSLIAVLIAILFVPYFVRYKK